MHACHFFCLNRNLSFCLGLCFFYLFNLVFGSFLFLSILCFWGLGYFFLFAFRFLCFRRFIRIFSLFCFIFFDLCIFGIICCVLSYFFRYFWKNDVKFWKFCGLGWQQDISDWKLDKRL